MQSSQQIKHQVELWARWIRVKRAVIWGIRGLAAGLLLAILAAVTRLLQGDLLPGEYLVLASSAAITAGLVFGLSAYLWPFAPLEVARQVERNLDLQERVSTSLEIARPGDPTSPGMRQALWDDTYQAVRSIVPRRDLPLRLPRWELGAVILLVAAAMLFPRWGAPYFQQALAKEALEKTLQAEQARIEALINEVGADPDLPQEVRERLLEPLQTAARDLSLAPDLESALAALSQSERALEAVGRQDVQDQIDRLREVGGSLSQSNDQALSPLAEALEAGNLNEAGEALEGLNLENTTTATRSALAEALRQAAEAAAGTPLAEGLLQTAANLEAGALDEAQEGLEGLSQALSEAGREASAATLAGQLAGQLEEAQGRMLEAAQASAALSEGNNGSQSQEGQSGSTQGQQEGLDPETGEGSGAGTQPGSESQGMPAGIQPIPQDNQPGDGGLTSAESLFAPQFLGGDPGESLPLPESGAGGDVTVGESELQPGAPGPSRVPYEAVFPQYLETIRRAMSSGQVPPHLQDLIQTYFTALEP